MRPEIQFFQLCQITPEGLRCVMVVGRGTDQTLWVDAVKCGVTREMLDGAEGFIYEGRLYVNARIVADNSSPEVAKVVNADIDSLLDELHPTNFRGRPV